MMTFFKCLPNFPLLEGNYSYTNVAEEFCWEIAQAAGSNAAASEVPLHYSLDFNWTFLVYTYIVDYVHAEM
jgi:hypothetical protein